MSAQLWYRLSPFRVEDDGICCYCLRQGGLRHVVRKRCSSGYKTLHGPIAKSIVGHMRTVGIQVPTKPSVGEVSQPASAEPSLGAPRPSIRVQSIQEGSWDWGGHGKM